MQVLPLHYKNDLAKILTFYIRTASNLELPFWNKYARVMFLSWAMFLEVTYLTSQLVLSRGFPIHGLNKNLI